MRNKLQRFDDNLIADNIIEPGKELYNEIKGNWNVDYFNNDNKITLELGCGTGAYVTSLGQRYSDHNYIGVDIKGSRIWAGSQFALDANLTNVGFLRTQIEHIDSFFDNNEVSEILITFPDPRPKLRDEKRRLTSKRFLDLYKKIITPRGNITLKTDNQSLYEYTKALLEDLSLDIITDVQDLHYSEYDTIHKEILTSYERRFISEGLPIFLLTFAL